MAAAPLGSAAGGGRGGQRRRPPGRLGGAQGAAAAVLRHQRGDAEDGEEELGGPRPRAAARSCWAIDTHICSCIYICT